MKSRSRLVLMLSTLTCLLVAAGSAHAQGGPPYDLTGTWRFVALDTQQSFCDGSSSQEVVSGPVLITQADEFLSLTFPDPPNNQVFEGRTSSFFIGAENNTAEAITVLTGTITQDANRISGNLVFYDRNPCPDAETGSARFILIRVN